MNDALTADARRFRLSLAASVFLNIGLLVLVGWLDRSADFSRPQRRPHLRIVTFSRQPAPPSSARRGIAAASRLAVAALPPQQPRPRQVVRHRTLLRPPMPLPVLRVVTTTRPSERALVHQAAPDPPEQIAPPPHVAPSVRQPVFPITAAALPAVPITAPSTSMPLLPVSRPSVPATTGRAPVRQEASRGTVARGTGWTEGAGNTTNQKAAGPFGIGDGLAASGVTRHIVYVLDTSGSMKSRLGRAEDELMGALRGLRPGETFNIVSFSGGSLLFDPDMAEAAPGSIGRASAFLRDLEAGGDTDLKDAVVRALMLRDVNEVVILTDGVPTVGETDPEKLAQAFRRFNLRHAHISTIGLVGRNPDGTDGSFAAAQLLQQIARDSGGTSKLVTVGVASP